MTWNAETILNLNISNENNVLKNIVINGKQSKFNIRGYATAEEVSQRAFENAIKDLLDILTYWGNNLIVNKIFIIANWTSYNKR